MSRRTQFCCVTLLALGGLFARSAAAHISLEQGGTHKSRYGDGNEFIKTGPCGVDGGTRGTNVYTYEAGETVQVTIAEYIPHPSYFRIAFDNDGDDGFAPPASIDPIDPMRACPFNAADKCGSSDYYNNDTVLPMMDDLNPHLTASFGQKYTWDVKMPNVECDNCTLQIIQVMEDTIHGAYNPVKGDPNDNPYVPDIYYQCIDLVLKKSSTTAGGDAGSPASDAGATIDTGARMVNSGGCRVARSDGGRGTALFAALAALGAVLRRRRARYI